MRIQAIGRRVVLGLALAVAALAMTRSVASAAGDLPQQWNPRTVAVNHEAGNSFLLRPGQIIAAPGDAQDVQRVLTDWRPAEQRPFGLTLFTRATKSSDPAREVLDCAGRVRK